MDSLTRLVKRTLAQAPVARPLIAPRFAAGPAVAAGSAPDAAPGVETEAGGMEPPAVSPPRGPSAFSPGPMAQPGAAQEERPGLLPPVPEAARLERPVRDGGEALAAGPAGNGVVLRAARPGGPPAAGGQPGPRPAPEWPGEASAGPVGPRGTIRSLLPEQPAPGGAGEATASLAARPSVAVGSAPVRPVSERRAAAAPGAPSQPPTIRVTIGRVEVRAVTPPAPAPALAPPARPEPLLSLDDYLEQRDEARR